MLTAMTALLSTGMTLRPSHLRCLASVSFVPKCEPHTTQEINTLKTIITGSKRLFVVTGAGISTESGIPDYRSEGVGLYARSNNRPIQHNDFMTKEHLRKRYWARNFLGWPRFSAVEPNATHMCLSQWEKATNKLACLVTQNVDRLHHKAGSRKVVELHGTAHKVICMDCGMNVNRHDVQRRIEADNPNFVSEQAEIRPDGDVELSQEAVEAFHMPVCERCSGILKPDIVFFGDYVPKERVEMIYDELDTCDCVLGIGSSFQVFSSYRFLIEAHDKKIPIVLVNIGATRADHMATLKISRKCGEVFEHLKYIFS